MAMPAQSLFYFCFCMGAMDALDRLDSGDTASVYFLENHRFEFGKSFRASLLNSLALQGGGLGVLIWV